METTRQPTRPAWEHRLQAVLALLGGEPIPARDGPLWHGPQHPL